jgi:manganese/zinc/iron transport system substrate-binding protein
MLSRLLIVGVALAGLLVAGCQKIEDGPLKGPDLSNRKARVVATTGMIADAVKRVGGDRVEVDTLMGPGVDPHRYIPRADDLTRLQKADVIFYNGLHLEGKMTDVFEEMRHRVRTVAVAEAIDKKELRQAEEGVEGEHDPHVWFDVRLWMRCVESVRDALAEVDPAHATTYRDNAAGYLKELEALHEEVLAKAKRVADGRRVLITAHDAFGYFGRAYGFEVKGLQGVSTASDTSSNDVRELAEFIGHRKIPAIFGETSVPDRGIKAVQESVRSKYKFDVRLAEAALYSDALGEPGSGGETYVGMVRHNIDAIVGALAP